MLRLMNVAIIIRTKTDISIRIASSLNRHDEMKKEKRRQPPRADRMRGDFVER